MGKAVDINEVVRALACYLRLNPYASDTTEGIRLWWFDMESEVTMDLLLPALTWMVDHRIVEAVPALDGHLRYRRTASDLQIDAILQGRSAPDAMATYRAIAAVSSALEGLIRDYYPRDEFDAGVQVSLYQTRDFEAPMDNGFSVFLFHVGVNPTMRNLALRRRPDGRRVRPSLPLDLQYMISTWATDVQMQHRMLGWVMRMLEDNSVLSAGHLNHYLAQGDAFADNEGLEVVCEPLPLADYLTLWGRLRPRLPVSATYRIRAVMLDSEQAVDEGPRVQSVLVDGQGAPA